MEVRAGVGAGVRVRLDGGEACVQLRGLRSLRHPSRLSLASRLRRRLRRGQLLQLQLRTQAEPLVARRDLNLEHLGRWRGGGGEVVGRWQEMERSGRREPLSTTSPPPPHHLSITSPPPLNPHPHPPSPHISSTSRRASASLALSSSSSRCKLSICCRCSSRRLASCAAYSCSAFACRCAASAAPLACSGGGGQG